MAGAATLAQGRDRRRKIVKFLEGYIRKHGFAPSVEDISVGVGIGKTAVRHHLAILQKDGHITMETGKYRSFQVVAQKNRKIA